VAWSLAAITSSRDAFSRCASIKRFIVAKVTVPRGETAVQALQIVHKIRFVRAFSQRNRSLAVRQLQP
jgi:hypothetical protein